ncbi:uncharacterized protein BP01DRAFT_408577 [Aspergillus saccharolyticus JOP 1030-1]|uniref:Uncharacterized protein n=1 Tax=Aspergillus saccharolyticus JOP 1030-1 TaxID=1450539 RepID=A0A318Z135_9EURO|nr:hypothetical protein BP01DRAFT_408577 [Aspergillus saccharolyticus JOP 1030-1]PYH41011.1 hypothetical protein BP01DRAFT_408577 [Aspergillus saccharolyticus JOP 1030-1]
MPIEPFVPVRPVEPLEPVTSVVLAPPVTTTPPLPTTSTKEKANQPPTATTPHHSTVADCNVVYAVTYTFYGYPDNDPPGADIAYNCGRGTSAGGTGTWDDPLTFATAPGEFAPCEVIYAPYIQKYLIHEDYCETCTRRWNGLLGPQMWHVDVWLGGDSVTSAGEQLSCENQLTPGLESQVVIRDPRADLPVDDVLFYAGGRSSCGTEHVYHALVAGDYC